VGVEVRVVGELPSDETVARAFAEIVLEAVTNAAKHAQARRVDVRVCRGPGGAVALSVTNDGCVPEEIVEGTGIPGMRRIAAAVGASFDVSAGPPFSVEVVLPASGEDAASEALIGAFGPEGQAFTPETQDERGHA
jgi:signal transduction histidine kinase